MKWFQSIVGLHYECIPLYPFISLIYQSYKQSSNHVVFGIAKLVFKVFKGALDIITSIFLYLIL